VAGVDNTILSSDLGLQGSQRPVDGFRSVTQILLDLQMPRSAIRKLISDKRRAIPESSGDGAGRAGRRLARETQRLRKAAVRARGGIIMDRVDRNSEARLRRMMWRIATLLAAFAGLGNAAFAEEARKPPRPPIVLESTGAYEVGGKVIAKPGDPSQTLSCDHGYVEYFIPAKRRSVGLILWHSSSTKVWENRWDGGEGYKSIFLRAGYPVYLWDGPRVGRANWSCEPITYTPDYFDQRNFAAWRFGLTYPNRHPGLQFPTADKEAWNQATLPVTTNSIRSRTRCFRRRPVDRPSTGSAPSLPSPIPRAAGGRCCRRSRQRATT
jgi:hypothetical protein